MRIEAASVRLKAMKIPTAAAGTIRSNAVKAMACSKKTSTYPLQHTSERLRRAGTIRE